MEIRISVRAFVEFLMRSGDIDNRRSGGSEDALLEGARIHRMIQRRMGAEYHAEVSLSKRIPLDNYDIVLEGRADGIIDAVGSGIVTIDEIKSTYRDLKKIKVPEPVHMAQAKCYAYIYASQFDIKKIKVQMTYCNIDTEELKYFRESYSYKDLEEWFLYMLSQYRKWSDFEYSWRMKRQESIRRLVFPFEFRKGQKQLVGYVYQTITEGRKLFLEAPTGVGKTISTMYPAIKAMGESKADKLFYLTAKTITGAVARETASILQKQGLCLKTVTITAKEKMCPLEECNCNPEQCPYAKGHFDRINDAVYDLLCAEDNFTREMVLEYALKHEVCPFEMCLDMSLFADVIVGDYNYLFDPYAYLRRFFGDGLNGKYIFLIDEAHNLVERGRDMYSAVLIKEHFLQFSADVKVENPYLAKLSDKCNKELLLLKKECENYRVLEGCSAFVNACNKLHGAINQYLEDHEDSSIRSILLDFYFELGRFLDTYDRMDASHYVTYTGYTAEDEFFVKEFCVDPSVELKACMDKGVASILFSATFLPIQYYKSLLGGTSEDYEAYAHSSFSPNRQIQLIGKDVTSKYTRRGRMEYENIARYIKEITGAKVGNYMAFFPSHSFLNEVYEAFMDLFGYDENIRIIRQESRMTEAEREGFIEYFSVNEPVDFYGKIGMEVFLEEEESENDDFSVIALDHEDNSTETLIGFCVQGGIFSEGIDLKNDSLIGAIIIGTGFPQIGPEREILMQHFNEMGVDGFDFAYKFPGMNKVLQAAGRVIRTVDDAGVIALLDERFLQTGYKRLFPAEWQNISVVGIDNANQVAETFWKHLKTDEI